MLSVRVLAQVDAKMVKPQPERPIEGTITIHSEISPMASSDYEPGRWVCELFFSYFIPTRLKSIVRPSDEEVTITRMLDKVLRRSDAVDKESLCILAGQRVCLSHIFLIHLINSLACVGLAYSPYTSYPCRCRKYAWLCMSSRDCSTQALSKTRRWGHWRRSDCCKCFSDLSLRIKRLNLYLNFK